MSKRYGIIVTQDDGKEVVSNILEKEGGPPFPGSDNAQVIEDLDPRVKIGMVRGGKGEAAAGFGWDTDVATPPVSPENDAEAAAEAKKAAARARLEEAKGDDDFDARQQEAERAAAKSTKTAKAADDKAPAKKA